MKKRYQIESQRAVNRLEEIAAEGNPAVQMVLPMAEMVGWLRKGVGELVRQAGLQLMELVDGRGSPETSGVYLNARNNVVLTTSAEATLTDMKHFTVSAAYDLLKREQSPPNGGSSQDPRTH